MNTEKHELNVPEAIMSRVSVRQFTDKPVTKEETEILLRAAMSAPSAMNKQPWEFYIATEESLRKKLSEAFPNATYASHSPLVIIPCGNTDKTIEGEGEPYWIQDLSAAVENILIAAEAIGLGAVWCGIHPIDEREKKLKDMLGFPENIKPLAILCIGHSSVKPKPKDKWNPEAIHYLK